jgi:hypothetical protein
MKIQLFMIICLFYSLQAGENRFFTTAKSDLIQKSISFVDSVQYSEVEEKSGFKAALYSAILPGAGEFYAESYWKAAIFTGIEIAAWTTHFIYDAKGSDQDRQMRRFADLHWDERKYWSWLYYKASQDQRIRELPEYQDLNYTVSTDANGNPILVDYSEEVKNSLRFLEDELNHTHRLPETRTQQYYEMIYKYLTQFGNGWEDATDFDFIYENNLTPQMASYRNMRNRMNDFFDIATNATNVVLLNHLLSAIDAAWTVRGYNRSIQVRLQSKNEVYLDEMVQMYGVSISW